MIVFSSLQIRRGVRVLLDNATATINPGQKVGLVGKNGCGKSTFFALVRGELAIDNGSFSLPAGNYATSVLDEILHTTEPERHAENEPEAEAEAP